MGRKKIEKPLEEEEVKDYNTLYYNCCNKGQLNSF